MLIHKINFGIALLLLGLLTPKTYARTNKSLCTDCNVVLIAMDALQARYVSHLNKDLKTTPAVDELAKNGTSFSQAISPSSWTVPTYLSIFTSTYPSEHGLTNRYVEFTKSNKKLSNFKESNPDLMTLAQILKSNGYATAGFTGDSGISAVLGYNKGFDVYFDDVRFGGLDTTVPKALDWLKENLDKKVFLFLHGYDQHGQYPLPQNFSDQFKLTAKKSKFVGTAREQADLREKGLSSEKLEASDDEIAFWRSWYAEKIKASDRRLQDFFKSYSDLKIKRKTIFILLSDHGTEFFEHGKVDHGHTLYDELIHVPFVISGPHIKAQSVVHSQVSTIDLLPTLVDYLNLPSDKRLSQQMKGRSLLPALLGKPLSSAIAYSETDYRNYTHKRSLRDGEWKYIITLDSGKDELYNIKKDPFETNNLASTNAKQAALLRKKLMDHLESISNKNLNSLSSSCLPVYIGQCE